VVAGDEASQLSAFDALGAPLHSVLTGTRWGPSLDRAQWALVPVAAVAVLAGGRAARRTDASWRAPARRAPLAALVALAVAMLTMSLQSHGASRGRRGADDHVGHLHLLAAARGRAGSSRWRWRWTPRGRLPADNARRALLGALAARFSRGRVLSTGTLIITGLYSRGRSSSHGAPLNTPFGRTIVFKASLLAVLIALGAVNLRLLRPRCEGRPRRRWLGRSSHSRSRCRAGRDRRRGLTSLEPGRPVGRAPAAASEGDHVPGQGRDARYRARVKPGATGANPLSSTSPTRAAVPSRDGPVALRVQFVGAASVRRSSRRSTKAAGATSRTARQLSLVGRWQLEITVSRPDALDARPRSASRSRPPGRRARRASTAPPRPRGWPVGVGGILLGDCCSRSPQPGGRATARARGECVRQRRRESWVVVMWFGSVIRTSARRRPNHRPGQPFAPEQQSIAKGRSSSRPTAPTPARRGSAAVRPPSG